MKTLIVLRHAKSSWSDSTLSDHERPLNKRGKRDAPRMGKLILHNNLTPSLIISSTAVRAKLTAEAVADSCGYEGEIATTRDFYHADARTYIDRLNQLRDEYPRVMVVGHNPGMEELVEELSGVWERMPTAAVAVIELPLEKWSELSEDTEGKLLNVWIPREVAS